MKMLVDIGGTYARFAIADKGAPKKIVKFAAGDFKSFEDGIKAYAEQIGALKKMPILISTAAHPDGKVWRFVNKNKWVIDPAALGKKGFKAEIILNDFEAATWGLIGLKDKKIFKTPRVKDASLPSCLIGPGTGLGLGYLTPLKKSHYVQKTMGGHMPAASVTAEQDLVLQTVRRLKKRPGAVVWEDLVSGFGLMDVYAAFCQIDSRQPKARSPEELLERAGEPQARAALRLFHEFFGLFAATVTVSGNSYGGLYLAGGVIDRLTEKNLFNFPHFEKFFVADLVPSVRKALENTPVCHVTDPYLALKGLVKSSHA